jgi:hypothetical protein
MIEPELKVIEDSDMDSMFILPLSIIPIDTPQLRQARMIKNGRLKSVVEVFRDEQTGSGQLDVEDLPLAMEWPEHVAHPDHTLIRRLALMPSYDVYSLRMSLRSQKIPINDIQQLKLSPVKMKELTDYMMAFTRPLLQAVFGDSDVTVGSYDDLMRIFRDPDVARTRERLRNIAKALGVEMMEVPVFLEDYGDTFMSLSYYRHCLDRLNPYFAACLNSIPPLRQNFQLKQDPSLMRTLGIVENALTQIRSSIKDRLDHFDNRTRLMWQNMSKEEFKTVKGMIEQYHLTIGGALCGLTVKMNDYARHFPQPNIGGPVKRADFMRSEMTQGIDLMRALTIAFKVEEGKPSTLLKVEDGKPRLH